MPVNRSLETALDLLIYFHAKLKHLHNSSSDKCPFLGDCEELRQMGSSKTNVSWRRLEAAAAFKPKERPVFIFYYWANAM